MAITTVGTNSGTGDFTSTLTVFNDTIANASTYLCQAVVELGGAVAGLDGSGGDFELTVEVDSQVYQPAPQTITFGTDTRTAVVSVPFFVPASANITVKAKSPNGADTAVSYAVTIYRVDFDTVTLANGAHGGPSATLTLSSARISNSSGDALTISGAGGSAIVCTSDDTDGTIDINSTASSGFAVMIDGGSNAGGVEMTSAADDREGLKISNSNGFEALLVTMSGTVQSSGMPAANIGTLSADSTGLGISGINSSVLLVGGTTDNVVVVTDTSSNVGGINATLATVTDVTEYPITITPVTSTVSAGEVSETECTAYTDADFSFAFTIVDGSGNPIDLSAKTIDFICEYNASTTDKFILSTGAEGGVAVSGANNNIVTVTGTAALTGDEGSFPYALRNATDDDILARGTLNIVYAPERDS